MDNEQPQIVAPRAKQRHRGLRPANRPSLESPYRKYDFHEDGLRSVGKVVPALLSTDGVSIDGITDHLHLLVAVTTLAGHEGHILVCDRGWMPLSNLDPYEEVGERTNMRGWTAKFEFSTAAGSTMRCLRLSWRDNRKIVAAILKRFMGAMDPNLLAASRYRPY